MLFQSPPPPPPRPMPITVFVHGTQFHTMVRDVDLSKKVPPESQTPRGLHPVSVLPQKHKMAIMLEALSMADSNQFPLDGIYTFGWSGENLVSKRRSAAQELFNLLKALCQSYEEQFRIPPQLTVITHSHGGNVLLHMVEQIGNDLPFYIKHAVLLACPVQEITAKHIHHPIFKSIYSFHSHDEWAQIADPQAIQPFREAMELWRITKKIDWNKCRQLFLHAKGTPLFSKHDFSNPPQNLVQAAIHWQVPPTMRQCSDPGLLCEHIRYQIHHPFSFRKRGLFHLEFITNSFIRQLPQLMKNAESAGPVSGDLLFFIDA